MRIVRIPKEFRGYDYKFYLNFIKTYKESSFLIDSKSLNSLLEIDTKNITLSFYVIYQIILGDSLSPNSINPKPSNGIELRNPNTKDLFGIYHVHLEMGYVLLWYLTWNRRGYTIKFDYLPHPPPNDNYETIIKNIYTKNDDGFNIDMGDYFINLFKILNFDISEHIILRFKNFNK